MRGRVRGHSGGPLWTVLELCSTRTRSQAKGAIDQGLRFKQRLTTSRYREAGKRDCPVPVLVPRLHLLAPSEATVIARRAASRLLTRTVSQV